MNDLQLLAQLAMQWMIAKGGNIQDALDKAEALVEAMIERRHQHTMKHMTVTGNNFQGEPEKECYHCRMIQIGMKEQKRQSGLVGPGKLIS